MTNGKGTPPEAAPPPQLNVLAQYTKDLSFENPNAPGSLAPQQQQPAINIQINVNAGNVAENDYEVALSVEGKAEHAGKLMFSFELSYAGVLHPERAAGKPAPVDHDRMPAAAVPVRAGDHCDGRSRRRLPALDARPRRFRWPVSPEYGTASRGDAGFADQAELNLN